MSAAVAKCRCLMEREQVFHKPRCQSEAALLRFADSRCRGRFHAGAFARTIRPGGVYRTGASHLGSSATALEGRPTVWHEGFARYDYVMDEQTLEIAPFETPQGEGFGVRDPAKGQRRCVVVVRSRPPRQALVLARLLLGPRATGRNRTAQARLSHRLHLGQRHLKPGKEWDAWYAFLTEKHGLSRKPAFIGMSRGGEYAYTWATAHPDKVSCIYADNPGATGRSDEARGTWPRTMCPCSTSAAASIRSGEVLDGHRGHLPAVGRPDLRDDQGRRRPPSA